eukprot:2663441-Rhodomonas_salina.1
MREIGVNDKALAGALAALESASFDHFHAVLQNELESRGRSAAPLATAQRMHKLVTGLDSEKRQKVDMAADSIVASAPAEECPHSPAAVQEAAHAPLDLREGAVDTPSASIPTVSFRFRSMKRAGRTLEDFFKTYLLFIDAERTEELTWKLLPTLSWLEGTIYFVDEENERAPPAQEMLSADADRAWQSMVNVMKEQGLWTPPIEQELRCGLKCAPCTAFSFSAKHAASSCALVQCSARWCVRNLSQLPFSSRAAAHLIHAVYSYWSFERRMKGSGLRQPLPSPHRSSSDLSLASGKQAEPKTANHQGDEERKHVEDAKRGAYKSDSLQAHRCDAASCLLAPSALESRGREQELSESMIKAALEHKSFDYRLLNLVAHTLLGKHLAPEHARFLR